LGYEYDAIILVSFGGPEGPAEVIPFLNNVLRGKNVPRERVNEVAEHYLQFGGRSPLNAQNRALVRALEAKLLLEGPDLPVYWGNRNWNPFLPDTLRQMKNDGVERALAFVTSAYSSYSGCRQYREDIARARDEIGPGAPEVDKLRMFYNHPGFIRPNAEHVRQAFLELPSEKRSSARLVFTAHSLPLAMARNCSYESQLAETARLVGESVGQTEWDLAYQSRSGPLYQPWLEPDILDHLRAYRQQGGEDLVVSPIGFISDHMEVVYDLDTEARNISSEIGLNMVRAATVGTHPDFVEMIRELILERIVPGYSRLFLGDDGPSHDVCPEDCCPVR
jgi:ferrochelatase